MGSCRLCDYRIPDGRVIVAGVLVLVTGATGRVGRLVVDKLLRTGASVRALTRRPELAALPAGVEVVVGDLTVPASLDAALEGAEAVFLVWTAAPATAPAV